MNKFKSTCLAAALAVPALAYAEPELSANVALTTDYVWRGYSQTLEDPAIQGGFDFEHDSGFSVGVWGSNVDFGDSANMEFDIYGGYSGEFGDGFSYGVGLIYYMYPGTISTEDYDWLEFNGSLGWGPVTFAINYSNDVYNSDETGIYYNLSAGHEIQGFSLAAGIGYYDYDAGAIGNASDESVIDYHLGVGTSFVGVDWDLSYYDTNSDGEDIYGDVADGRVVLTVSKSF
jgi:uncharacterized protein (TIGR02001 family)